MSRDTKMEIIASLQKAISQLKRTKSFADSRALRQKIDGYIRAVELLLDDVRTIIPDNLDR